MDALLLKAAAKGRESEEKRQQERRRNIIVLILRHLLDNGYTDSYERLTTESNISLSKVDVADNVDLLRILQEYEEHQEERYAIKPKLVRKVPAEVAAVRPSLLLQDRDAASRAMQLASPAPISGQLAARQRREKGAAATAAAAGANSSQQPALKQQPVISQKPRSAEYPSSDSKNSCSKAEASDHAKPSSSSSNHNEEPEVQISVQGCSAAALSKSKEMRGKQPICSMADSEEENEDDKYHSQRLLKPLPVTLLGELRELGSAISRDIYLESPNVHWDDIAGLQEAKRLLKESVVLPLKYPHLFTGLLAPWRGLLLYGPPGTGKTLLAKAVATQCRTTFFNISASSMISKWRGDSEKLVRVLFDLARHHAPSTIFLDEIDALMGARGAEGEHEASRRMKTELLIQMDGLARSSRACSGGGESEPQVFVLCATNLPWELDMALLRRLEKRILVPLPDLGARTAMLSALLGSRAGPDVDLSKLAAATEGYSGSDITVVCKEAAMRPLRRLMATLEPTVYESSTAASSTSSCMEKNIEMLGNISSKVVHASTSKCLDPAALAASVQLQPVTAADVTAALAVTKASAQDFEQHYRDFSTKYGQTL